MTNVYVLILAIFLSSCVGTVQDAKVKLNSLFDESKKNLDFQGLEVARPVSHNKVELEFTPPAETDPNFKYLLYVNDSLTPIEINPESLDKAANGKVRYLADKLYINSKYKFKLRLTNILTGSMSINEKELFAQTFDNVTADFKGVTQVSKVNGQSDSSIRVDWASAVMKGTVTAIPSDPQYYEVTIIGEGGPEKLNDPSYTLPDKRKIRVPDYPAVLGPFNYFFPENTSLVIGSLRPDTEYFVQVRAIHNLYERFLSDPDVTQIPINKEVNTKFLSIRTDPLIGDFDFNDISFKAMAGNGERAKTSINVAWNPASGSYVGYRLFYIKCVGVKCTDRAAVVDNHLLTDEKMAAILNGSSPDGKVVPTKILNSTLSNYTISDLDPYSWYELKLVACRNTACLKDSGDAIESVTQAVRTAPMLAPFSGIIGLDQPESASTMDEVNVKFDVPDLVAGYADHMEFFCINPESVTSAQDALNYVQLQPNLPVPNSRSDQCKGLSLCGPKSVDCSSGNFNYSLKTGTNVRVKGVKTDGTKYCFAGFPAIRDDVGQTLPVTNPTKDWIIRCITPEVKTPTISQFPGISSTCSVDKNSISVSWQKPTAGIYNGYRVFWRTIDDTKKEVFSYDQTSGATKGILKLGDMPVSPYSSSPDLDVETFTYTLRNLRPGTRYKIGVLTQAASTADIKWSEFNTRVKDCMTAMPRYKFEEWTRIFAIGAKVDGRFPLASDRLVDSSAYIYEALNHDGVPYELPIDNGGMLDSSTYSVRSPGHYDGDYGPSTYADDFDGALADLGQGVGIAASNRGIVSLSWKDVSLDFLGDEFKDCQINKSQTSTNTNCIPAASKQLRRYGYKVYRSADNRLSWQDVTKPKLESETSAGSSLIYADDYSYYKRAEKDKTTDRMAFFTDYSVETIRNDATLNSKARIYWYKIIPYFDNKPIALDGTQAGVPNEIKVILPPDNMALMHRWMANRQACNEIERDSKMDKEGNYTCPFNGFGSKPKGFPWNVDNTVIDLGGHMLIDRFELGCNYTRGDVNANPTTSGQSEFSPDGPYVGLRSGLAEFKGFATEGGSDTTKLFKGCAQRSSVEFTPTLPKIPLAAAAAQSSNYRSFIQGDCVGYGAMTIADTACSAGNEPYTSTWSYSFPGATTPLDSHLSYKCSNSGPDFPTVADEMLSLDFRKNIVTQSEFAAVLYHTRKGFARYLNPEGPTGEILDMSNASIYGKSNTCYINLAAIGATSSNPNWIARWIPLDDFNNVKGTSNLAQNTVEELSKNTALYNDSSYKMVPEDKYNSSRFGAKTKIGRIVSNNASKLPPISNLTVGMAQSLCSTYEVEVGYSFNGINFLNLALPKAKRLMGRQELISASAWPDAADNDETGNFNYEETTNSPDPDAVKNISMLEGSKETRFCSVADKTSGEPIPTHGTLMKPGMTKDAGAGAGSTLIFTGSSANDGSQNSELCISKYGIQDIVGNAAELTTDKLFCDYRGDQLYYGATGDTKYDDSVKTSNYSESYGDMYWSKAVIKIETSPGVFKEVKDGEMWESISPNSGYCSIVDNTNPAQNNPAQNYEAFLKRFRDVNENFLNVLNPDQTLNSSMVLKANPIVQTNIDKLRNGDGSYLSFGVMSPGPIMQWNNTLSLSLSGLSEASLGRAALGPYFNPIVGMTMNCPGTSCDYSLDNKLVSTEYFSNNAVLDKRPVYPGLKVPYFPVGNSQIFSPGISETTSRGGAPFFKMPINQGTAYSGERIIYNIRKYLNGSVCFNYDDDLGKCVGPQNIRDWATKEFGSLDNVPDQYFTKKYFNYTRGSEFILTHGGDAMNAKTGRYTMQFLNGDRGSQTTTTFTAGRCGVLIED